MPALTRSSTYLQNLMRTWRLRISDGPGEQTARSWVGWSSRAGGPASPLTDEANPARAILEWSHRWRTSTSANLSMNQNLGVAIDDVLVAALDRAPS